LTGLTLNPYEILRVKYLIHISEYFTKAIIQ